MKKRIPYLVCAFAFLFSLSNCTLLQSRNNSSSTTTSDVIDESDERYQIYLLAKDAGYSGTYEEWLESIRGADGSSLLTGTSDPTSSIGKNGDTYINTLTWDVFVKSGGSWTEVGNILGQKGQDGYSLLTGHGEPKPSAGKNGDSYIDLDTWDYYTKVNDEWTYQSNFKGNPGSSVLTGSGAPSQNLGRVGDSYIDLDTWDFYVKESSGWNKKGNIKGEDLTNNEYHTVTFVTNSDTVIPSQSILHGEKVVKPTDPTKYGYNFDHWECNGEMWIFSGCVVTEDMTLNAVYSPLKYRTTINCSVASNWGDAIPQYYSEEYKEWIPFNVNIAIIFKFEYNFDMRIKLGSCSCYGYTFNGWKIDDQLLPANSELPKEYYGASEITADFTAYSATLTLDPNDGEIDVTSIDVTYGEEYSIPVPFKPGWGFVCWESSDGTQIPSSGIWRWILSDTTIVAVYNSLSPYAIGNHIITINYEIGSYVFPYASETDTLPQVAVHEGLDINYFHSYKGQYTEVVTGDTSYWLMMRNKDNWDATGQAWFGNNVSLGSINRIEVKVRNGASSKLNYDLSVGSSKFETAQTNGIEFNVNNVGVFSGSGNGFFAVSTKPVDESLVTKYNGQIASIKIDYTISESDVSYYYSTVSKLLTDKAKGTSLQGQLHDLMLYTHTNLIKYAVFSSYTKSTVSIDQANPNVATNEMFYTGKQNSFSTSFTREHVWACSQSNGLWVHSNYSDIKYYVDGPDYVGGGSDLYHVRPCTSAVNTARGSGRYKEFTELEKSSGNLYEIGDGGDYTLLCDRNEFSTYCEPADAYKGDIARILMYVYIHYSTMGTLNWEDYCGNLSLLSVMGYQNEADAFETLIRWNNLDPVSDIERLRNNTVERIQGNRNPFVDYPNLLDRCLTLS